MTEEIPTGRAPGVAKHAGRGVIAFSVLFLGGGVMWSYLRLLVCGVSPANATCNNSYLVPLSLAGIVFAAFAAMLAALSTHAGTLGDKRHFLHPGRPRRGFRGLPHSHRRLVRWAHSAAWTSSAAFTGFVLWFRFGAPSAIPGLVIPFGIIGAFGTMVVLFGEPKGTQLDSKPQVTS